MAKAAHIEIDADEPFAQAAARIVRTRSDELFQHADGVLDTSDIERVHDMRVASRRLRAVLEIFAVCFPKEEHRAVLGDVKRIADALGMRRDPDVHIASMERFAAEIDDTQRPGIELVIGDLREEQATGNQALAVELERMRSTELDRRLRALADAAEVAA